MSDAREEAAIARDALVRDKKTTLERGQSGSSEAWCLPRPRGSALLFPSLRRSPPVHLNRQRSAERL